MSWLTCLLVGHDPRWPRQARDDKGLVIPGGVEYECDRCGRVVTSRIDLSPSAAVMDTLHTMALVNAKARRKARKKQPASWAGQQHRRRA